MKSLNGWAEDLALKKLSAMPEWKELTENQRKIAVSFYAAGIIMGWSEAAKQDT